MTVRRGMADYRQAGAGGIIFMWLLQGGSQEMTYEQRLILYRSIYSAECAKLLVVKVDGDTEKDIQKTVTEAGNMLITAGKDYKSKFESHETTGDLENDYKELLAQIFDRLWHIAIIGKLIENVTVEQDVVG